MNRSPSFFCLYAGGLLALSALAGCSSKSSDAAAATQPYPPPAPDDCLTTVDTGMLQPFECGGLKFNLSVPDECLTKPCGLIADVHGFGMNAQIMEVHTKMAEIATAKGYIVMQPSAPGTAGTASWSPSNDEQVWAILQSVMNVWHTDPKRFHFDGYSQGGWMTWRFI